jgi:hypothetical protein
MKISDANFGDDQLKDFCQDEVSTRDSLPEFLPGIRGILFVALVLRLIAAFAVDYLARRRGAICLFGDSPIYWLYGKAIAQGTPYVVHQWDVPHYALRTPGYPLWLAANMAIFGENTLPVRIAQAVLGVCMVWWVYLLARSIGCSKRSAILSALITAIDPFQIGLCALILSESLFTPLLVAFVLGLVFVIRGLRKPTVSTGTHASFVGIGVLQAVLGLVRPSWLAFLPVLVLTTAWIAERSHGVRKAVLVVSALIFGWGLTNMPWALRNSRQIGRFAISGTWGGATLYDSVRPGATGGSEMSFVADPQFRTLGEVEQDDLWKKLSIDAIRAEPRRMLKLAIQKQKRFWSIWPNESAKLPLIGKLASAAIIVPVWVAMVFGWHRNRHSGWTYLVLSPLFVTALTHLVFVGSSRYRMAVIVPAMVLAGEGFLAMARAIPKRNRGNATTPVGGE